METIEESVARLKKAKPKKMTNLDKSLVMASVLGKGIKHKMKIFKKMSLSVHPEKCLSSLYNTYMDILEELL